MSGATRRCEIQAFAVESEDQMPSGGVNSPALTVRATKAEPNSPRIRVNDVFQVIDLNLLGFRFCSQRTD